MHVAEVRAFGLKRPTQGTPAFVSQRVHDLLFGTQVGHMKQADSSCGEAKGGTYRCRRTRPTVFRLGRDRQTEENCSSWSILRSTKRPPQLIEPRGRVNYPMNRT